MNDPIKIYSKADSKIALKVIKGHFATSQSHISHYLDLSTMMTRCSEAMQVAQALARKYQLSTPVDTIVCMDGLEVIGAYLAEMLTRAGVMSMNAHKTVYIVTPEYNSNGQIIFRDNLKPMIRGKHVVLLCGSITTGTTLMQSLESIEYYGGDITGISAVFSAVQKVEGMEINSIFHTRDIPNYESYKPDLCPACREKKKIDAMVNRYGYSLL